MNNSIYRRAMADWPRAIEEQKFFHMHPELSGEECRTAGAIARILESESIPCEVLCCHAVIGRIVGALPGKCVMLRADIDALEVQEETGLEYASVYPGISHACGHDYHIAALLSAARILNSVKDSLHGEIRLLFQPAEEKPPSGAGILLREYHILEGVDAIFGAHVANFLPAGMVNVQAGPRMAGCINFNADIYGVGGHGAMPQDCVDPIVAASAVVLNLQTIVSRELPTGANTSISVGTIHGGKTHNSIASEVHLTGAVKTMNAELMDGIQEALSRIIRLTCEAYRCRAEVTFPTIGKPLINDTALSALAERAIGEAIGKEKVVCCDPWPVGEDFTRYLDKVPGVYAFIGGRNTETGCVLSNHHPAFRADSKAILAAATAYAAFAAAYLVD